MTLQRERGESGLGRRAASLADRFGSPLYAYDLAAIREQVASVRHHVSGVGLLYAMKANPNEAVLRAMAPLVDGLDIASEGELAAALAAGYPAAQLSFAGPGKTEVALAAAIDAGVGSIRAESLDELDDIQRIASARRTIAQVSLRINPAEVPNAFRVRFGGQPSPFGIDEADLHGAVERVRGHDAIELVSTHVFAGTECTSAAALWRAFAHGLGITERVMQLGLRPKRIDLGGGIGVCAPFDLAALGAKVASGLSRFRQATDLAAPAVIELGRYLVADAGAFVATVQRVKVSQGQTFVILDGGLNHYQWGNPGMRPGPRADPFNASSDGPAIRCQLCGPLCTPLDSFGEVHLASARPGDRVVFPGAGAYGLSFSPTRFLGHPPPRELVMDGERVHRVG